MTDAEWVLLLSRGQFALTMGMHITLAALTLGLAPFLVWFEARWLWGRQHAAREALHFWIKIFALTVAIGAVSGVVMEFQFGTNWAPFSHKVGGFIGPLLFFEVLVAFFMESALTGVMLFGMGKIRPGVHFAVTCLVALGALISAFWILAANSWMQTPVNYHRDGNGIFSPVDWLALISAPSFPLRFAHMVLASYIAVAVMIAGVAAWRVLHRPDEKAARCMFVCAIWFAVVALPVQFVVGDRHGENTLRYQPAKLAAMEATWYPPSPGEGEPLRLFAIPDQRARLNHSELAIPDIGSLYLRHNLTGHIKSLSEFPAADRPPVLPVFFAFRIMVGLGLLMFFSQLAAVIQHLRGRLYASRRLLWLMVILTPAGFIAMLSGWVVTEMGRQPWIVQDLLRTAESVSALPLNWLIISCCSVAVVYILAFGYGLRYFLRYIAAPLPAGDEVVSTKIVTSPAGREAWKD
ncbi:cytochrome ubiquinol oxidase subunit I [Enterobacteriaceae bacterium H20N1]|uniref:Cytochrome ubiquinol oxidase subunit I n=1 Tax=Dryocola boscaweniae TaxID=2925397 RepID=A0A9X2WAI0_9ENTR|nr:cytochrome ubiquinol oxidase subunit I [Dryocola boscaweniae]MCT4703667.1 cytochrome ubiquinol oxidase subunit I [Dryocola boscaweniae]MCT4720835.1 cytochrome ubiquinol oxidase subunit I [Dryocola boscaweniae]